MMYSHDVYMYVTLGNKTMLKNVAGFRFAISEQQLKWTQSGSSRRNHRTTHSCGAAADSEVGTIGSNSSAKRAARHRNAHIGECMRGS